MSLSVLPICNTIGRGGCCTTEPATFPSTKVSVFPDDDMIMNGDVDGEGGLYQCIGQLPVGPEGVGSPLGWL